MKGACSSETSVDFQRTTRYIPEHRNLHNHRCENIKSYIMEVCYKFFPILGLVAMVGIEPGSLYEITIYS
jgi:hypothetical protein